MYVFTCPFFLLITSKYIYFQTRQFLYLYALISSCLLNISSWMSQWHLDFESLIVIFLFKPAHISLISHRHLFSYCSQKPRRHPQALCSSLIHQQALRFYLELSFLFTSYHHSRWSHDLLLFGWQKYHSNWSSLFQSTITYAQLCGSSCPNIWQCSTNWLKSQHLK